MTKRVPAALDALLIAAMFAIALWVIRALPAGAQIAIHWGSDGQPDAWMGQRAGLLVIPIVAFVLGFVLSMFPQGPGSRGKPVPPAARRALFLVLLAAQLFIAIQALGGTHIA